MTAQLARLTAAACSCVRGGRPLAKCPRCGGDGQVEEWVELQADVVDMIALALDDLATSDRGWCEEAAATIAFLFEQKADA